MFKPMFIAAFSKQEIIDPLAAATSRAAQENKVASERLKKTLAGILEAGEPKLARIVGK